jgi:hypothetical protein
MKSRDAANWIELRPGSPIVSARGRGFMRPVGRQI